MTAPIHPDESERLAALRRYDILDTPAEQAFDDLTLLAARICEVPTAVISFIDEHRQWFKSRVGIDLTESHRDLAFCAHTILQTDRVLEVTDASADPRFRDNVFVTNDPKLRFYAGAPLVTWDGKSLGSLCVLDRVPRKLTPDQLNALRALSRQAVSQLELRRHTRELSGEIAERQRAEARLRHQVERIAAQELESAQLLITAERSRRALLSVLEDEKLSVQKLRESEERFRQLAESVNEVFWMTDPSTQTILYISPAYETIWGRTCESLYADPSNLTAAIHDEDKQRVVAAAAVRQISGDFDEVYRIVRPDGEQRWIHARAFPVRNEKGEAYRIVGTAEDITKRKQVELYTEVQHAVTEVLSQAANLLETAHTILELTCRKLQWTVGDLWVVDRTTKMLRCVEICHPDSPEYITFIEASKSSLFGIGEGLPGMVWETKEASWVADLSNEITFRRRLQANTIGLKCAYAFPIKMKDHVYGVVEFFSLKARTPDPEMLSMFTAVGTQIGQFIERKQLEDQFRQAQKMEAIGTLAGGIAHDFNNVLAAIMGYTELAKNESLNNAPVIEFLQAVTEGSRRAASLVRQILAFSRQQDQQRIPQQLWVIVEEALTLLRATIPATIRIEVSLLKTGPAVLADATQIHQVVLNLATNAAHAMRTNGGQLTVTLEQIDVDRDLAATHAGLNEGVYMRLSVSDTGHGMDEATLSRIFDPFFTTKAPGEGTGLGLAVVHGIIQSHEGVITVYSHPGEGTRFQLYFPAHIGEASATTLESLETPLGSGQHILVIDDELSLALMTKKILERLDYTVTALTLPAEAERLVRAEPAKYKLVVTDLTMPGITGTELAKRFLEIRPDLPIILTTGYSATLTKDRVRELGMKEMLLKPVTIHGLGEAVHRALHNSERKTP